MIERPSLVGSPEPKGPYVPVVQVDDLLFVSGQGPIDPVSNQFIFGDIQKQTRLVIENIQSILSSCGGSLADVVKCSVFLANADDFAAMNEIYAEYFGTHKPARTTVAVTLVEPKMRVEIDCIARSRKK